MNSKREHTKATTVQTGQRHSSAKASKPKLASKAKSPSDKTKSPAGKKYVKSVGRPDQARSAQRPVAKTKPAAAGLVCSRAHRCGGCASINVPYGKQLACKQRDMENLFAEIATADTVIRPILGMADPFHYRNKVMSPFAPGRKLKDAKTRGMHPQYNREILFGMYERGTHKLVPTDGCMVESEVGNRIVLAVREACTAFNVAPYNEDAGEGFMRHVVVRVGHESGEVLVTLVTNGDTFPQAKAFCRDLAKRVPEITTIVQNVNERSTNVVLGTRERTLYGPGFILDTLCGLSFRISSQSFYQVNATQTEVLYQAAMTLAGFPADGEPQNTDLTCIDAYCGTGTIGLVAARQGAARVIGVESVVSAVRDARQNAQHNGVENAQFVCADAGDFMLALAGTAAGASAGQQRAHELDADVLEAAVKVQAAGAIDPARLVLLMDPPRAGSSEAFLRAAEALGPQRIVYVSCNPETQVRDIKHLQKHGYQLLVVQPVDMFPHTDHVESVALLSRVRS